MKKGILSIETGNLTTEIEVDTAEFEDAMKEALERMNEYENSIKTITKKLQGMFRDGEELEDGDILTCNPADHHKIQAIESITPVKVIVSRHIKQGDFIFMPKQSIEMNIYPESLKDAIVDEICETHKKAHTELCKKWFNEYMFPTGVIDQPVESIAILSPDIRVDPVNISDIEKGVIESMSKNTCPICKGSGKQKAMTINGPDQLVDCTMCKGSGRKI